MDIPTLERILCEKIAATQADHTRLSAGLQDSARRPDPSIIGLHRTAMEMADLRMRVEVYREILRLLLVSNV
jgi:hypothetical protein